MEKALTERVDKQAEDRVPAAKTANQSNRKIKAEDAAVEVPARVKAGVAVVVRDRAEARDAVAVAVKTVDTATGHALPRTQTRRNVSCQDYTEAAPWGLVP
jgi:hypothetical protein